MDCPRFMIVTVIAPSSPPPSLAALLIACVTDVQASDATLSTQTLSALAAFATEHGEIARLHHASKRAPGRLDRLAEITHAGAAKAGILSAWQATLTGEAWQLLDRAGIPARVFKGAALAAWLHGDATVRNSSDIDVLVPPAQVPAALHTLQADGWTLPWRLRTEHFTRNLLSRYREVPLTQLGGTFELDLHWQLLSRWNDPVLDALALFPTPAATAAGGSNFDGPCLLIGETRLPWFTPDLVWRLALSHVVSSDWLGLRAWIDLALVSDRLTDADWAAVRHAGAAEPTGGLRAALAVADGVLRAVFSRAVPVGVTSGGAVPPAPPRQQRRIDRVVVRVVAALRSDEPQPLRGLPLLLDCGLASHGWPRWRAAADRLVTPALDDRIDSAGHWRGSWPAVAAMLARRWRRYVGAAH